MSDRQQYFIKPEQIAGFLQDLGYRGKVIENEAGLRIESAACGLTFYVNLFDRHEEEPDFGFASFQFDTGMYLGSSSNVAEIIDICNRLNSHYRFAKFSVGGRQYKYANLQMDFYVAEDWQREFAHAIDLFLYGLKFLVDDIINSQAFRGDDFSAGHTQAIQYLFGAERDPQAALELYRKSAHGGYAGSQNNLGDQYELGTNIPKSDICAAYWYTRSAERGEPTAYLSLATLFSENPSDPEMLVDAAKYAILAVKRLPDGQNKQIAQDCISSLKNRLSEDEWTLAHELAQAWKPLFQETRLMSDKPDAFPEVERVSTALH